MDVHKKLTDSCTIETIENLSNQKSGELLKKNLESKWIRSDLVKNNTFEDQNKILKTTIETKINTYSMGKVLSNVGQDLRNSQPSNFLYNENIRNTDREPSIIRQNPILSSIIDQNYRSEQESEFSQNSIIRTIDNQSDQQQQSENYQSKRPIQRQDSSSNDFVSTSIDFTSNERSPFYLHENQTSTINSTPAHQWQQTRQQQSANHTTMLLQEWHYQQARPAVNPASAQKERQQRLLEQQRSSAGMAPDALITQQLKEIQFPQQPLNPWIGNQPVQLSQQQPQQQQQQQQTNYSLQQQSLNCSPQQQTPFPQVPVSINPQVIQSWNQFQQQQILRQHAYTDFSTAFNHQFIQFYVNSVQQNQISHQYIPQPPIVNMDTIGLWYPNSQQQLPEAEIGSPLRSKKTTSTRTPIRRRKKANSTNVKQENKENCNKSKSCSGQQQTSNSTSSSPTDSKNSGSEQSFGKVIINLSDLRNQTIEQFSAKNAKRTRGQHQNNLPTSSTNEYGGLYQNNYVMLRNWLLAQQEHLEQRIANSPNEDPGLEE